MKWQNIPKNIKKYQGFIYKITNLKTDKFYLGKKFFWSKKVRQPLKGRKNKRHYLVESDWKDYYGSCNNLLSDIKKYGKKCFKREIIKLCETKFDCAYEEMLSQIEHNVLFREDSYNEIINVRLRKRKQSNRL